MQFQRSQVMDGLLRIERGTYGVCADCGKPIPEGRLDARPEAARCVACQSKAIASAIEHFHFQDRGPYDLAR